MMAEPSETDRPPSSAEVASPGERKWTPPLGYPKPLPYDPTEVLCDRCQKFNWRYHFLRLDPELRAADPMMEESDAIIDNAVNAKLYHGRQGGDFADLVREDPFDFNEPLYLVEIPSFHAGESYYMTGDRQFALFTLGTWGSVVQSAQQCNACRLIYKSFSGAIFDYEHPVTCWSVKYDYDLLESRFSLYKNDDDLSPIIFEVHPRRKFGKEIPLGRFSIVSDKVTMFSRPTMNPLKFDSQCAKVWLKKCLQDHEGPCKQSPGNTTMNLKETIIRVFDVHSNQVVVAPIGCDYISLSYVWGNTSQFQLQSEDVDQYSNIAQVEPRHCSKSVQDAIEITRELGERYLWVDTLCIPQDNDAERKNTIHAMNHIYENAKLTIVACDGEDANSGILNTRRIPKQKPLMGKIAGVCLIEGGSHFDIELTPWNKRAWTYQEFQLSRRLLIFHDGQAFFSCRSHNYSPAQPLLSFHSLEIIPRPLASSRHIKYDSRCDNLQNHVVEYHNLVEYYTGRNLTYEEDSLYAFAGISERLSDVYDSKYCWGLPVQCFQWALCWIRKGRTLNCITKGSFPSWAVSSS